MPSKNTRKIYIENGYYHIYNRGVEKRVIYSDEQDYNVFLSYLNEYLSPKDEKELREKLTVASISSREKDKILKTLRLNNFNGELILLAYCLMPNHFHLFLKQRTPGSIDRFMNSIGTRYTMYFNKKYKRIGTLYEGVFKAVLVKDDAQFLHFSRYIHRQAIYIPRPRLAKLSSYPEYLGLRRTPWVHPEEILDFFSLTNKSLSYKDFVESGKADNVNILRGITLEV